MQNRTEFTQRRDVNGFRRPLGFNPRFIGRDRIRELHLFPIDVDNDAGWEFIRELRALLGIREEPQLNLK